MAHCLLIDCLLVHCLLVYRLMAHLLIHLLIHCLLRAGAWLLHLLVNNLLLRMGMRLDRGGLSNRLAGANRLAHRWRIGLVCLPLVLTRALGGLVGREGGWLFWSCYSLRSPKPVARRVLNRSGRCWRRRRCRDWDWRWQGWLLERRCPLRKLQDRCLNAWGSCSFRGRETRGR